MALGTGVAKANADLADLDNTWLQLHVGDPGASGTANVASNSTRKQISLGTPSAGSVTTDADLLWSSVPTAEDYSHFSLHSAVTAGTFQMSGTITANAVAVGDDFKLASGSVTLSIPVAS